MQRCSPLWSASSFTLRCPFYSLFPRATLPHRPLLPTHTHTQKHTLGTMHSFLAFWSQPLLFASNFFFSLFLYGMIIYTRKDLNSSTQSQTSHIRTRSPTRTNVLSHTNTHSKIPLACPRILSAHARSLALGAWWSAALSPWATECPITRGKRSALPPEVKDSRHERLRQARHGGMTHLQDMRYIWRAREGERKWQRKREGGHVARADRSRSTS